MSDLVKSGQALLIAFTVLFLAVFATLQVKAGEKVSIRTSGLTLNGNLQLTDGQKLQLKTIEDADHYFRDFAAEELADIIDEFIKQ